MQNGYIIANNLNEMEKDIRGFGESLESFKAAVNEIIETINTLNGMWEGSAHEAFMNAFASDEEYLKGYISFLDNIKHELEEAKSVYAECETCVEGDINKMLREIGL